MTEIQREREKERKEFQKEMRKEKRERAKAGLSSFTQKKARQEQTEETKRNTLDAFVMLLFVVGLTGFVCSFGDKTIISNPTICLVLFLVSTSVVILSLYLFYHNNEQTPQENENKSEGNGLTS